MQVGELKGEILKSQGVPCRCTFYAHMSVWELHIVFVSWYHKDPGEQQFLVKEEDFKLQYKL